MVTLIAYSFSESALLATTTATIATRFSEEQQAWRPTPEPFVADATTLVSVSPRALVRIEGTAYSVPCRWAGLDLVARIGPVTITIVGRDGTRIPHARKRLRRALDRLPPLPAGARPQAAGGASGAAGPATGARRAISGGVEHVHTSHGPREAARLFAKILGELETRGVPDGVPALQAALASGAPLTLARLAAATPSRLDLPATLRDLEIVGGCAADLTVG